MEIPPLSGQPTRYLTSDGWIGGDTVIGTNGLKGGKIFGGKIIQ